MHCPCHKSRFFQFAQSQPLHRTLWSRRPRLLRVRGNNLQVVPLSKRQQRILCSAPRMHSSKQCLHSRPLFNPRDAALQICAPKQNVIQHFRHLRDLFLVLACSRFVFQRLGLAVHREPASRASAPTHNRHYPRRCQKLAPRFHFRLFLQGRYKLIQKAKSAAYPRSRPCQFMFGVKSFVRSLLSATLPPGPPAAADPNRLLRGAARSPCPLPLPFVQPPACTESFAVGRHESSRATFHSGHPGARAFRDFSSFPAHASHSPQLFRSPGKSAPAPAQATAETLLHSARSKFQKTAPLSRAVRDAPSAV